MGRKVDGMNEDRRRYRDWKKERKEMEDASRKTEERIIDKKKTRKMIAEGIERKHFKRKRYIKKGMIVIKKEIL